MPGILLAVRHQQQQQPTDCLAACAAMALDYLHRYIPYDELLKRLEINPDLGAPASKIRKLVGLVSSVVYTSGTLKDVADYLAQGLPCIAFVHTLQLSYWAENARHAVVVIGINQAKDRIFLDDPFFDAAPQVVSLLEFQLAWDEMDNLYSVLIP